MNQTRRSFENPRLVSADKNAVIDRAESLAQVDEDSCTVLSFIDDGYDIVQDLERG